MIQIYAPQNKNYEANGDMTLFPESCDHIAELGGAWTLEITHPIDQEGRWKYIEAEAVLSVPTFMGDKQLFRISEITDKSDTEISAKAYPIFFDSADDHFLMDVRPTEKTGQEALDIMTAGSIYRGESNITTVGTAYFVRRNLMDAIGGESPSFVEIWGGEPLYDNFRVIINERAGGDYGAEIRYGKNMESISASEDMSEVVTRIVPVAFNGYTHSKSFVDSPLINHYAQKYIKEIKFEDVKMRTDIREGEETNEIIICENRTELDAALEKKCQEQFDSGIDKYKATIEVNVVALENTEEYKDFKDLVKIGLGDTVRCYNSRLDISTEARAIKIKWDCIENKVKEVTLGDYKQDFFDKMNSSMDKIENITNPDGSVNAEKVQGILNAMNTQLRFQKNVAQKQDVRAILFEDLDPESELFGALAIGTQGLQISNKRTADGRDWDWTTAITANGAYADAIITGILADKTGKTYWNLDTGEMVLSPETKITWGQVTGTDNIASKEDIPKNTSDLNNDSGYQTSAQVTQITKDTVTTAFVNALKVKAGSVDAENITGTTITGKTISGGTIKGATVDVSGTLTTNDGTRQAQVSGGSILLKYKNVLVGRMDAARYNGNDSLTGIDLSTDKNAISMEIGSNIVFLLQDDNNPVSTVLGTPSAYKAEINGSLFIGGYTRINNSFVVDGVKSRVIGTSDYGERLQYCYEMASPIFGDIGEGITDENGECFIYIDDIFQNTVTSEMEYQVFLQAEGSGELFVKEKKQEYFVVNGDPNLKFSWEVKAKQKGYEYERLETPGMEEELSVKTDYESIYKDELNIVKNTEEILYETIEQLYVNQR